MSEGHMDIFPISIKFSNAYVRFFFHNLVVLQEEGSDHLAHNSIGAEIPFSFKK